MTAIFRLDGGPSLVGHIRSGQRGWMAGMVGDGRRWLKRAGECWRRQGMVKDYRRLPAMPGDGTSDI